MKRCYKCKQWKEENEFHKDISRRDGIDPRCKLCQSEYKKKIYIDNKAEINIKHTEYRKNNKEKISKHCKEYRENNKEREKQRHKEYRDNNKEKINKHTLDRLHSDGMFRLNKNISTAMRRSLKGNKNGLHWETLVPYNADQAKIHLISTLPDGYTWQDYLDGILEIDHFIPVSVFCFSSPKHIDFQRCWALSNLRLLPAKENRSKSAKLNKPFQPSLKLEV